MTKRVNLQDKPLVKNLEEADATLARIAELGRRITLINTALNDDVAKLQLAANEQLSPLTGEKELLESGATRTAADYSDLDTWMGWLGDTFK